MVVCISDPMELIEAIPNVSEGRRHDVVEAIAAVWTRSPGAWVLDVHEDPSHHRSVITAAVAPEVLVEASCDLAEACIEHIDLSRHQGGVHPRIGALDVLPFVPLFESSAIEVIALAREVGSEIARRFDVPVFLYGRAKVRDEAPALHQLRRGGLDTLARRIIDGELVPDFGLGHLHPTAGALAIGVRDFLVAYNVALKTTDATVARQIAALIRESAGGLSAVQALGMSLSHRNLVQVSMNLTDFRKTSLRDAFDTVREAAAMRGIEIDHSEIVGLIPAEAAFDDMVAVLQLEREPGILEERMAEAGIP